MSDQTKAGDLPLDEPPHDDELGATHAEALEAEAAGIDDLAELDDDELAELVDLDEIPAEPIKRAGIDESVDGEPEGSGRSELDDEGAGE